MEPLLVGPLLTEANELEANHEVFEKVDLRSRIALYKIANLKSQI